MKDIFETPPQMPLRPPSQVMRLSRMGAMFPTRLSFLRSLMRRLAQENACVVQREWVMCADGFGHAVFSVMLGGYTYSLVAISTDLPAELRTDRVIATAWDTAYVLFDGLPAADDIARIKTNAPLQEAGRFGPRDLILSRANKSVRLFAHVVEELRAGRQPDLAMIRSVGYLMRTTAVYGNGKFGIADRAAYDTRPGLEGPFAAEMLTVWLIRHFTHALAEHAGRSTLDRATRRYLGIGNSTGLGMAPFLVNHPVLLNNWMLARETALARVRAIEGLTPRQIHRIGALARRAGAHLYQWQVPDPAHQSRIDRLRRDWTHAAALLLPERLRGLRPLDAVMRDVAVLSEDVQELMAALLIEPFGELVDGLAECMADPFGGFAPPLGDTDTLRAAIEALYDWALGVDYAAPQNCTQFWYVSQAKMEPRLGLRFEEEGAALETPLDIGRRVKAAYDDLPSKAEPVSTYLNRHPDHALAVQRVTLSAHYPYGEIRDNLIAQTCLPIDMLRCKLSFFGASKFDPKCDRWTRITLCQGAPLAEDLEQDADDWWLPVFAA
ncbi:hypothetical protein [Sulfitobacter guttiformis]|uniref:Uncharacterized protein n=1 Tax=Sulfitobacter guttiformis TaxID=74349 RepID=A0A420DPA0_9RHOB|nr:hypothetical protein [Sulfitobacter guttiformis]KIN73444.1 hypothetical protein Z949_2634 [Sulfitobacter guttiformis KCTC 32187]RKE96106.1 hypothetical protein C8N30_0657 [Sulfitobacter guttiformis]